MAVRPDRCLHILSLTASNHRVNLTEQGLRLLAGIAMVVRAPLSKLPDVFEMGGWFIVATSVALMIIPLRWHSGYAVWWSKKLPFWAVRAVAPFSISAGAALVYFAL